MTVSLDASNRRWPDSKLAVVSVRVTLAIVFKEVVRSTALGEQIRDEAMKEVRRAHFAQS